jgi:hypothetical protein
MNSGSVTLEWLGQEARRTQERLRALELEQQSTGRTMTALLAALNRLESGLRDDIHLSVQLEVGNAMHRLQDRLDLIDAVLARIEQRLGELGKD